MLEFITSTIQNIQEKYTYKVTPVDYTNLTYVLVSLAVFLMVTFLIAIWVADPVAFKIKVLRLLTKLYYLLYFLLGFGILALICYLHDKVMIIPTIFAVILISFAVHKFTTIKYTYWMNKREPKKQWAEVKP